MKIASVSGRGGRSYLKINNNILGWGSKKM